jgi:purine nucleosidase
MSTKIPLLIDTDPGVDDALALLMAFQSEEHNLLGLCIAAGNVGIQHTCSNALKLCEVAGIDVPIYQGCAQPLVFAAEDAAYVHGLDGFGDIGFTPALGQPESEHAALAIIREANQHAGNLLLVTLGPLTNLALAVRLDPTLPSKISRLVVMGGAVTGKGNTNISAEFNIGFDPESALIVFESFPQIELVDWEAVLRHGLKHIDVERWLDLEHPVARFYQQISLKTRNWSEGKRGEYWHSADALAMLIALHPEYVIDKYKHYVHIETQGAQSRGATLVDWANRTGKPAQTEIIHQVDQLKFEQVIQKALGWSV